MPQDNDRMFIKSLAKGLKLLSIFNKNQPRLSLSEIAKHCQMNLPTARRYLHTLTRLGFVIKDQSTQLYQLTPMLLRMGLWILEDLGIRDRLFPYMVQITEKWDVTSHCAILVEHDILTLERLRSSDVVNLDIVAGSRIPAHCTSLGKVLLAYSAPEKRDEICSQLLLKAHTPYTITDLNLFISDLEATRTRGYATAIQELTLGLKTMAVPIFDVHNKVAAAFGVSYPLNRAQDTLWETSLLQAILDVKEHA